MSKPIDTDTGTGSSVSSSSGIHTQTITITKKIILYFYSRNSNNTGYNQIYPLGYTSSYFLPYDITNIVNNNVPVGFNNTWSVKLEPKIDVTLKYKINSTSGYTYTGYEYDSSFKLTVPAIYSGNVPSSVYWPQYSRELISNYDKELSYTSETESDQNINTYDLKFKSIDNVLLTTIRLYDKGDITTKTSIYPNKYFKASSKDNAMSAKDHGVSCTYKADGDGIISTRLTFNINESKDGLNYNYNQIDAEIKAVSSFNLNQATREYKPDPGKDITSYANYNYPINPNGISITVPADKTFPKWEDTTNKCYRAFNESVRVDKSATLKPYFESKEVDIFIYPNGGKFENNLGESQNTGSRKFHYTINNNKTDLGYLTRSGYNLIGFSKNSTDTTNTDGFIKETETNWKLDNSKGLTGDYYAIWKPDTYTITYKLNYKKPILGTENTTDTKVNFFNKDSNVILDDDFIKYNENDNQKSSNQYSDYTINGNNHILKLNESAKNQNITFKEWLVGYEYTKGSGKFPDEVKFSVDKNNTQPNLNNYDTLTSGVSLNDKYGNGTLVLNVLPINYEITYTESSPRLDDRILIKTIWNQKNVEIELKPESDLPTSYTILDDPKDLFSTRLLKEDKSAIANIETNKLKLGLDRGLYYNGNLKSKDNYSFSKLTENNKGINGPYQDYGKLYFTQEYKLSKFKFRFNYKYNGDEYPSVDSDDFEFMGGREANAFSNPFSNINLTPKASNNFTFDGWVDSEGIDVIDKNGNITNNSNKELKYFWGKKNSNNQYTYYLIAEKNEDPNKLRIIDLYPKWVRQSGPKVFDGKEWQYPTENGNTNVDNIKINDVDWNNIKEMKVYDGTEWNPVNLNHRPPGPPENTYEEM